MQELISVIIPAYNVEKYIKKCVESVINQTWENIEIILVDDGSTDKTGVICDELSQRYEIIHTIHQKNAGLSVARNVGIENCRGDWIAFLDSDDWIEPQMYELLHDIAVRNDVSLSSCLSRDIIDDSAVEVKEDDQVYILNYRDIVYGLLTDNMMRFEVWNKLWKRDLIGDVRFIRGQVAEDVHFDALLFKKAGKIAHINTALHNYLISRPGNTNSSFKKARLCIFDEFKMWKSKLSSENEEELANVISAIAANFAVDIYGNAVRTNQSRETLGALRQFFLYFYKDAMKVKLRNRRRIKYLAFKYFPRIFCKSIYR